MKIPLTEKLTLAYVQKQGRYAFFATTATVLLIIISVFWMLFQIGGTRVNILFSDIAYTLTAFVGAIWVFYVVYSAAKGPLQLEKRFRLGWLLIGLGTAISGIGGAYYAYQKYVGQSPFPSYGDILSDLSYPLVGIGLILLPVIMRFRMRTALDAGITTLSVLGVSWFFLIGPLYFAQRNPVPMLDLLIVLSYPTWDIFLALAVVLLIQRRTDPILHPSLLLFVIAMSANIWADSAYAYLTVFGHYQSGTFYIDPFWIVGYLLTGLAALYQYNTLVRKAYQKHTLHLQVTPPLRVGEQPLHVPPRGIWYNLRSSLIYLPILSLLVFYTYTVLSARHYQATLGLLLIMTGAGILFFIRCHIVARENTILLWERQQRHLRSEQLRHLSTQFMAIMEREPLCERIVQEATAALGFEAALLLLHDSPYRATQSRSGISGYLAIAHPSAASPSLQKWVLPEEHSLSLLALSGKELTIEWNTLIDLEPKLQLWQHTPHTPHPANTSQARALHVFPLSYQGEILGCLGAMSQRADCSKIKKAKETKEANEHQLLQAYAEQVAIFIEHAHLSQEMHEHEMFARALANLATRLNSAIVKPTEVHQIICQEANNALQADYALLYVSDPNGDLMPIALHTSASALLSDVADWPLIHAHEPEAQALFSLQPMLQQRLSPQHKITKKLPTSPPSSPLPSSPATQTQTRLPASLRGQQHSYARRLHEKLEWCFAHTLLLMPFVAKGDPIALLVLARSHRQSNGAQKAFDAVDMAHAQDFAEQAVVAFINAHLYQELHAAHQRLQELDRLKDQFMITASHELRTPLTSVQGYLELLAQFDETLPPEHRQEFLHNARRGCDELVIMLNNIMDTSRLEVDAGIKPALLQQVCVRTMVEDVIDLIKPQLVQEHREVQMDVPSQLTMRADPLRLRQVLLNLSTNALKYSPTGSPLRFDAQMIAHSPICTVLSISDRGQGIAPAAQASLFQRFVRLERDINSQVRGSGLGLYISRRLIEAMGGKIWVESKGIAGEGSTFHIQLPTG